MYIRQHLLETLRKTANAQKVVVIYGPRRTGKTTLIQQYAKNRQDMLLVNGDDITTQTLLASQSTEQLVNFIGNNKLLIIDEAQQIPNIGMNLKLLIDHVKGLKIIATGSSSFDLNQQVGEPLTGRKITLHMYPLSQIELNNVESPIQTKANLEARLIYGSYPEVILSKDTNATRQYLHELTSSYLIKDILELEGIRKSHKLTKLLQLLAFQIGKEVSLVEIGRQVGLDKKTVEHYVDLLVKAFVLVPLSGFSRNLRKEISKSCRYYFYDLGIRNALINQFNPLALRSDVGELWENYLVMERLKKQDYFEIWSNNYYWRTYDQKEIDWIEDREGTLFAYEFKWQQTNKKPPKLWVNTYPNSEFNVIHPENYIDFIS